MIDQTREKAQRSFATVLNLMDQYPENAFFNVGTIEDVIEKAKTEMGQE